MSSGKDVVFDQFADCMKLVQEGNRTPEEASVYLSAMISGDNIVVIPKVTTTPTGKIFHVTSNWKSAEEAISAGNYVHRLGQASDPLRIPMVIRPVNQLMRAVRLGKVMTATEILTTYPNMVSPIAALTFGAKRPKKQEEAPYIALWLDALGQVWCVVLSVNFRNCGRCVDFRQVNPDHEFIADCRILLDESGN